jgi:uncharacterized protein (DUF433 family)
MKEKATQSSPEILGGEPVFSGTSVPVQTLIDYLDAGDSLGDFLEDFPSVTSQQVLEVLEAAESQTLFKRT